MTEKTLIATLFGRIPPKPYPSKHPAILCTNPGLIAGLELETENCGAVKGAQLDKIQPAFGTHNDGSLRGVAYEFVSRPMKMENLIAETRQFFNIMKFTEKNYTDRCSIHVHTNLTNLYPTQVASLALVYSVVEDVLFDFVNKWEVENPYGANRDTNLYCVPWSQCRINDLFVSQLMENPALVPAKWIKYTALNFAPIATLGTAEWRHMHGTSNLRKIEKWLNIIGSIMQYATETPYEKVSETIQKLNDTSAYQVFFENVMQGHLRYRDKLGAQLARGVVNAKYGMIQPSKETAQKKKAATLLEAEEGDPFPPPAAPARAPRREQRFVGAAGVAAMDAARARIWELHVPQADLETVAARRAQERVVPNGDFPDGWLDGNDERNE